MALTQVSRGLLSTSIVDNGNATAITIDSSENVGIGTTNPNDQSKLSLTLPSGTNGRILTMARSGGSYAYHLGIDSSSKFTLYNNDGTSSLMAVDISGNLLVGKTANDNTTAGHRFTASGFTSHVIANDYPLLLNRLSSDGALLTFRKDSSTVGSIGTVAGRLGIGTGDAGLFFDDDNNKISPVTMATGTPVDSNGLLDLGYSGARFKDLYLSGNASMSSLDPGIITIGSGSYFIGNATNGYRFNNAANTSNLMILQDSGNLLVGVTSITDATDRTFGNAFSGTSSYANWTSWGNGTHSHAAFRNGTNQVGTISTNSTSTTYNTSSDQRLKENIADADDAGSKVDAIQVRKFDWIADGSHQDYGMVAQELQAVAPEAVSAPEDPDEMMGVDYSKLVPMLVKEIQSLRNRVAQLENN